MSDTPLLDHYIDLFAREYAEKSEDIDVVAGRDGRGGGLLLQRLQSRGSGGGSGGASLRKKLQELRGNVQWWTHVIKSENLPEIKKLQQKIREAQGNPSLQKRWKADLDRALRGLKKHRANLQRAKQALANYQRQMRR